MKDAMAAALPFVGRLILHADCAVIASMVYF
jgi:hypothetical protein